MTLALVMGGGGVAGIAWHTGILLGLSESGVDPSGAGVLIGTSAGATVAAQIGCGHPPHELFDRQVDPATLATERTPPVSMAELVERMIPIYSAATDADERRRLLGAMALDTHTVDERVRRAVIAARLAEDDWPDRPLLVPVVDATTGGRRVLDRSSGVDLVDAVAASSAVPGVSPRSPSVTPGTSTAGCGHSPTPTLHPGTTGYWCWPRSSTGRSLTSWPDSDPRCGPKWCPRTPPPWRPSVPTSWTRRSGDLRPAPAWPRVGPRPSGYGRCSTTESRRRSGRPTTGVGLSCPSPTPPPPPGTTVGPGPAACRTRPRRWRRRRPRTAGRWPLRWHCAPRCPPR